MSENDLLALEVERFVQHVQAFAHDLARRLRGLPREDAEALLDQELVRLAVRCKKLEATTGAPEIGSIGYKVGTVVRTRVAEFLESH